MNHIYSEIIIENEKVHKRLTLLLLFSFVGGHVGDSKGVCHHYNMFHLIMLSTLT